MLVTGASWGGLHWERQIRASPTPRRPPGSAAGAGMSVLVTGVACFIGTHCPLALGLTAAGLGLTAAGRGSGVRRHGWTATAGVGGSGETLAAPVLRRRSK